MTGPVPDPFYLRGGHTGILLLHGFTGSPSEMIFLGQYLNQNGYTVSCPLLPGHGTVVTDLNHIKWTDWIEHATLALESLKTDCQTVFVAGLSMGALLTMVLASKYADLKGMILYSPATILGSKMIYLTPFLKYFFPTWPKLRKNHISIKVKSTTWSYSTYPVRAGQELLKLMHVARSNLSTTSCPGLIVYCDNDPNIHPKSAVYTYNKLNFPKKIIRLQGNSHCITMDTMQESVAQMTLNFILDTIRKM